MEVVVHQDSSHSLTMDISRYSIEYEPTNIHKTMMRQQNRLPRIPIQQPLQLSEYLDISLVRNSRVHIRFHSELRFQISIVEDTISICDEMLYSQILSITHKPTIWAYWARSQRLDNSLEIQEISSEMLDESVISQRYLLPNDDQVEQMEIWITSSIFLKFS